MACISTPTALLGGSLISGGSSLLGGLFGSSAASKAGQQQAQVQMMALMMQAQQQAQVQKNLSPFTQGGQGAFSALQELTGTGVGGNPLTAALTKPFAPTMDQLSQTPGYQFALDQGLKATQNSFAAQGLGASGAAMKGGVNYAEGLAGTTFQQQFQNYLGQNQQIYNMLGSQASLGENAGVQQGNQGNQLTGMSANSLNGLGAAQASGTVGANNNLFGGLAGAGGAASNALMMYALGNSGMFGKLGGGSGAGSGINWDNEYGG
jgi:hypothetical protein